jgi:RNA polymerase sigma-70 factor, ECF subfamily
VFGSIPKKRRDAQTAEHADVRSFEYVYDATFDRVYRMAFASLANRADAEDATAETYERALRSIARFRGDDEQMTAWLYGIARNVVREYRRDRDRKHQPLPEGELDDIPDTQQEIDEINPDLALALYRLPAAQREVLELRLAGLKVREVAAFLGKAEGTVKALQHAAITNLRKAVGE